MATVTSVTAPTPDRQSREGWQSAFFWAAVLVACAVYGCLVAPLEAIRTHADREFQAMGHPQTLLGIVIEHWLLIAMLVLLVLIIAGRLGGSLGLPALFRDAPPPLQQDGKRKWGSRSRWASPAFWGGLGATLLVGQVWTVIYYSELTLKLGLFAPGHFEPGTAFRTHDDLLKFLRVCCPPFLVLILLAAALPAPAPGLELRDREFRSGNVRFFGGMVVSAISIVVFARVGSWFHVSLLPSLGIPSELPGLYHRLESWLKVVEATPDYVRKIPGADPAEKVRMASMAMESITSSFVVFVLVSFAYYIVILGLFRYSLSPGLAICVLLSFGAALYSVMMLLSSNGQMLFALLFLGWIVLCNWRPYDYRFPGMQSYYKQRPLLDLVEFSKLPPSQTPAPRVGLLTNEWVLRRWKDQTGQDKPKLVLVAVTGGAYRAAFWTTVVLDELGNNPGLPGFQRHVRLMTGASGGMVGAAYYVAQIAEQLARGKDAPVSVTDLLRDESDRDSLTPVVRRLLRRDLPRALLPFGQEHDRGIELEQQWKSLAPTFAELRAGEESGRQPSLIVSPMVIESGRRLLISNLDLQDVVATRARVMAEIEHRTGVEAPERVYARSAAQFFRLFPDSYDTFRLQTAVRMNATFPYASPAVSLPTTPPRRVVDAGYYDNYGVDLAAVWAYTNQEFIRNETSGVALIQIRAYPSELDTLLGLEPHDDGTPNVANQVIGWLKTSVQGLTSPLEAGLNARAWSMRFHNAAMVRILDDTFNNGESRLFETFFFENFADFAMNWFISDQDIAQMRQNIWVGDAPAGDAAPRPAAARTRSDSLRLKQMEQTEYENWNQKQRLIKWWSQPPRQR